MQKICRFFVLFFVEGKLQLRSKCSNGTEKDKSEVLERESRLEKLLKTIAGDSLEGFLQMSGETYAEFYDEIQELGLPCKLNS